MSNDGRPDGRSRAIEPLPGAHRPPVPIRSALDALASTLGLSSVDHIERLFFSWEQIVGENLAEHCRPHRLEQGILRIRAADQGWATELRWMTEMIAERCNEALGADVVTEVRITR